MIEGWHFILHSQKRHYFNDGRSLCGRFYAVSPPVSEELNRSSRISTTACHASES